MRKSRSIAILVLSLMFVFPLIVQIGADHTAADLDTAKTFIESYEHHEQIWIQSNEEFDFQASTDGWAGDGSEEHPYIITGYLFDCESQPIRIWDTNVHWILIDNIIDGVGSNIQCGTWIENVTNGAIIDNEIFNRHSGIAVTGYTELNITGNYIHDCWGSGIEVLGMLNQSIIQDNVIENVGGAGIFSGMSKGTIVKDNSISSCNSIGISLVGVVIDCILASNVIFDSAESGLIVSYGENTIITGNIITFSSGQGIYMNSPEHCTISQNIIGDISGHGIRINAGDTCEIKDNIVENCTLDGIRLDLTSSSVLRNIVRNASEYSVNLLSSSNQVTLKFNTFIDNGNSCHVCDDGTANIISENYFDDWSSPDADVNGYVDNPYMIDGSASNQDEYPLAVAGVIPTTTPDGSPMNIHPLIIIAPIGIAIVIAAFVLIRRR
ncbi:MAG: right-handed parallel beta-helix repeat-containing protein [Candidatus Thorarchaeota archaeon]